ncbi:hypothetical protein EVAR_48995_1 [Eumeta japonica]|uniref:Uncharacterized protein n=1 Tax=Eumeta variegata TaxID=151549 RepID=A0A4C1Z1K3_EUMVA|nr:hypothetical protein EVAR_48995_1 [Eumeta japonica]
MCPEVGALPATHQCHTFPVVVYVHARCGYFTALRHCAEDNRALFFCSVFVFMESTVLSAIGSDVGRVAAGLNTTDSSSQRGGQALRGLDIPAPVSSTERVLRRICSAPYPRIALVIDDL